MAHQRNMEMSKDLKNDNENERNGRNGYVFEYKYDWLIRPKKQPRQEVYPLRKNRTEPYGKYEPHIWSMNGVAHFETDQIKINHKR